MCVREKDSCGKDGGKNDTVDAKDDGKKNIFRRKHKSSVAATSSLVAAEDR